MAAASAVRCSRRVPPPLAGGTRTVTLRLAPPARWVIEYYQVTAQRPGPDETVDVDLRAVRLEELFAYEPGWGLPSRGDRAAITEIMTVGPR